MQSKDVSIFPSCSTYSVGDMIDTINDSRPSGIQSIGDDTSARSSLYILRKLHDPGESSVVQFMLPQGVSICAPM